MKVYIIGAGGHGEVVLEVLRAAGEYTVAAFLDSDPATHGKEVDRVKVLGPPDRADGPFLVAIGDNAARMEMTARLTARGAEAIRAIHPVARVASTATVGPGALVCAGAILCTHAHVGAGAIINTGAIVEHHNHIGPFAHIAPGAVLAGRVTVAQGAMVGAGATVIPHVTIGEWAVVGAGAVVLQDVPDHSTVVGVHARIIRRSGPGPQTPNPRW